MGNQYANWDDRPYRDPPEPPARPSFREWVWSTDAAKIAYEAGIQAYLMASCDPSLYHDLVMMAEFYQTWYFERCVQDANWKARDGSVGQEFPG